ncbi:metapyrocatechase [Sphingomonas populi]|uniref:Metapyrocatechase n=1 Tax=Sphingomonas populi TaxID=2484750 RepID=A0A4Q6Y293_9SPHN|nr:VOC family protein [Sphingomonas populi]RZF63439.1 metapyrocatechase [Sphingomonas populi]
MLERSSDGASALAASRVVAGIHSLDHFAYDVPDLNEAAQFYTDFGLDVKRVGDHGLELYTFGNPHCWAKLTQGPHKKLRYLSFGAFERDLPHFEKRVDEANVERCAPLTQDGGIWFLSPDGLPLQIKACEKSSPAAKTEFSATSSPPGKAGAVRKAIAPVAKPRRLAHIMLFTANISGAIDFYSQILGLRLSDRSGDIVAFMHGIHGSDHHLIALAASDRSGLHHSSWDMPTFHDVGLASQLMIEKGHSAGWGLGRHLLGANYFYYVRDPWMSFAEYSADIDFIPAGAEWPAADYTPDDAFSFWGPPPPPQFAANFEPF